MPHFCLAVIERCQTAPSPVHLKYLQVGFFVTQTAQKWKASSARKDQRGRFPPRLKREDTVTDRRRQDVIVNVRSHRWGTKGQTDVTVSLKT